METVQETKPTYYSRHAERIKQQKRELYKEKKDIIKQRNNIAYHVKNEKLKAQAKEIEELKRTVEVLLTTLREFKLDV
jgi:hypothetical protein